MKLTKKSNKLLSVIMVLALLITLIPVNVSHISAATSYKDWKQYDSAWASEPLGDTGTIQRWGCKITSIAILMVHAGVESEASGFNPCVLKRRYDAAGYISHSSTVENDGNLSWAAVGKSYSPNFYTENGGGEDVSGKSFSDIYNIISSYVNQGYFIEVRVKNNGHSVAVNYCANGEVYIMDPGSTISTLSSYVNNNGNIARVIRYTANGSAPAPSPSPVADTLSVSGYNYPTTLSQGQSFSVYGTVTSAVSNITSLTAGVYSGATLKTGKTVSPNAKSYSIKNVDAYITFNTLAAGTYYYKVMATNAKGTSTLINRSFTVTAPVNDTLTVTGYNYPTTLNQGQSFSVYGTVTSAVSNITSLTAGVYTTTGALKTGKTVSPNAKSYSIKNVDAYISFGSLAAGTYYYKVMATNAKGTSTLINRSFTVKAVQDTLSISGYNTPPASLTKGKAYSIYGTVSSAVSNISSLTAGVYTTGGVLKTGKTVYPNAKSYSLKNVDAYISFGSLPVGTYYYRVYATNSAGQKLLVNYQFKVV